MSDIHIDIESFSELDLLKVGGYNYAMHPSTEILMIAYAFDHGRVKLWDCTSGEPIPQDLQDALAEYHIHTWHAFNANFERTMFKHVWQIDIPVELWRCSMVHAWSLSFSGGLADIGKQLGLSYDQQKLAHGKRLIHKFCKPAPKNHKVRRYTRETSPAEWAEFCEYCEQDVTAERHIESLLQPYPIPDIERTYYQIDQDINDRGMPINRDLVDGANRILWKEKMRLKAELKRLTGLDNPTAWQQMRPWYEAQFGPVDSFDKDAVDELIKQHTAAGGTVTAGILTMYRQHNKTSTAKWVAIKPAIGEDGRFRGGLAFGGAQRTQRWSGRILQPHNIARGRSDADQVCMDLMTGDNTYIQFAHGDVMSFLRDTLRTMIQAPPGKVLNVCDLGSIESRGAGWLTNCAAINTVFAEGRDTYRAFGSVFYQKPEDQITPEERTFCKPPVLGGTYGLGGKGLVKYADSMGVTMEEEQAQDFIDVYRATYPELPECWSWLTEACMYVTATPAAVMEGYKVKIYRDDKFLFIKLPSGRSIAYYEPLVEWRTPPWGGAKRQCFTYMGMDQYKHQWTRIATHGGKILENIDQALCRDILAVGMHRAWSVGLDIILHVHDELVIESDIERQQQEMAELQLCMTHPIAWAPGLLLAADGFSTRNYKKG